MNGAVRYILFFMAGMLLFGCAPVLDRELLKEGNREMSFRAMREHPDDFKGKLFVMGGVIVRTKLIAEGSQIEAIAVPVDRYGYFTERGRSEGRFLAIMPVEEQMLDPEVFQQGRRVTLAGRFAGLRKERIDEMDYAYPVFRIEQIYLWHRESYYYPDYYYDPWFYPYPYYYWGPWWGYPYPYYYPYYYNNYYYGPPPYRHVPHVEPRRQPVPGSAPSHAPSRPPAPDRGAPNRR